MLYSNLTKCCILCILGTGIITIPLQACYVSYGEFDDLSFAKLSCKHDNRCISIVDPGCDEIGPFQACEKEVLRKDDTNSICSDPLPDEEGESMM